MYIGVQQSQARDRAPLSERRIVEQPPATPAPAETRRKKTGRKPNPDINAEDENSLYFIIRNCKGSIPVSILNKSRSSLVLIIEQL